MAGSNVYRIKTISEFHKLRGLSKPEHPLISVVDYREIKHLKEHDALSWVLDFYSISIKRNPDAKIRYGQQQYDFDEGVMFFMAPKQVFGIEVNQDSASKPSGRVLLFHPDFLWNTHLAKTIRQYQYFSYAVNEALHLSEKEEAVITSIIRNIEQ